MWSVHGGVFDHDDRSMIAVVGRCVNERYVARTQTVSVLPRDRLYYVLDWVEQCRIPDRETHRASSALNMGNVV